MISGTHNSSRPSLLSALIAAACFSSALAEEDYDYDVDIAPILQQYCVKCHGPEKQKSKFRLDSYERLMRGGSSEAAPIIPYQPMQSPMVEYLLLPKRDEYALPLEELLDEKQRAAVSTLRSRGAIIHKRGEKAAGIIVDLQQVPGPLTDQVLVYVVMLVRASTEV